MSIIDVKDLQTSVDAFKRTVDTLGQIKGISEDVQTAAKDVSRSSAGLKTDIAMIIGAARRMESSTSELSSKTETSSKAVRQSIKEQEALTESKINECVASVNEAVTTVADGNKSLAIKIQEYAIGTSKSVDELRLLSSGNAREVREKINNSNEQIRSDIERQFKTAEQLNSDNAKEVREKIDNSSEQIRSDIEKLFKAAEQLNGDTTALRASVGKLQTISAVGCAAAIIAAILAAISFFI